MEFWLDVGSAWVSDYVKGFGGKFGVQTDRQDKSALGWDHQEKLQLHESQKGEGVVWPFCLSSLSQGFSVVWKWAFHCPTTSLIRKEVKPALRLVGLMLVFPVMWSWSRDAWVTVWGGGASPIAQTHQDIRDQSTQRSLCVCVCVCERV